MVLEAIKRNIDLKTDLKASRASPEQNNEGRRIKRRKSVGPCSKLRPISLTAHPRKNTSRECKDNRCHREPGRSADKVMGEVSARTKTLPRLEANGE